MVGRLISGVLVACLVSGLSQLAAQPLSHSSTPITVLLCDKPSVAEADKAKARAEVDRILNTAHVQLRWVGPTSNETCTGPQVESFLSIILLPTCPKDLP